jgi:SHS family lactate transporter-like MFS transporter
MSASPHSPPSTGSARAVAAGFLGWTLDAFDFFLVVMTLTTIGAEFHKTDKQIALSVTLTLAFRPLGAIIFGLLADRYGRRIPFMIDLIFYSTIEVLTGFVHSYRAFLILRALFGIGMGGEWGVGASLTMEKVPPKLRGLLSGLLQEGYAAGYLLAAIAYGVVAPRYGWRPLFFIGGLPALLAIFVRLGVAESDVWQKNRPENWSVLFRSILQHWKIFLYIVVLMTMMNLASHGTQDLYPTFLQRQHSLGTQTRSTLTAISMIGAILGGLCFGRLSDLHGRKSAMIWAFAGAICLTPLWILPQSVALLAIGAMGLQFMVQGAWGVIPAHINELSPDTIRGFMPGFAYQCGNLLASYIVVLEATLAQKWDYPHALMWSAITIFIFAIVVTYFGKENPGVVFGNT